VKDLKTTAALSALRNMRRNAYPDAKDDPQALKEVVRLMGGRLSNLAKAARSKDMLAASKELLENEKSWILDLIGLIPDHDDDVMDEVGKPHLASCTTKSIAAKMEQLLLASPPRVCQDACRR
jgi:hypothetical protein